MIPRITAVLLDLGDTLWHFPNMPPHPVIREETIRRLYRLLESWGIEFSDELRYLGRDIRLAVEKETERAFRGDCLSPHYPTLCQEAAARLGLSFSDGQAEEVWEAWNLGGPFLGRQLFPDVIATLRWLRDRGYRLGSVTNRGYGGPRFQAEMRDLGLSDFFEVVSISCDLGYMKPHPRILRHALDAMGLLPQETVMVGDNLRADVAGAKALGLTAVWRRPPLGEPVEETADKPEEAEAGTGGGVAPDHVIDNIADLRDLPIFNPD